MGFFKLSAITDLENMKLGEIIKESDFSTLLPSGKFVQMEYVPEEDYIPESYSVKPGVFSIVRKMNKMELIPTEFTKDKILEEFISTKTITDTIDRFFNRLDVYREEGIEVPKRGALLYGPAGSGKTTAISAIVDKYAKDNETLVVVWRTDSIDSIDVKMFIKSFEYKNVSKLILIAEDIGGIENDNARVRSDSSLLAILDNKEKTFKIPVYIIATTNYPENLMANLTNRPDRFDDKIEVGYPSAEARKALLKFYLKDHITDKSLEVIASRKCEEFTPAHIREVRLRSRIHDKNPEDVIEEVLKEIKKYKEAFQKQKALGMGLNRYGD